MREGLTVTTLGEIANVAGGAAVPPDNEAYVGLEHFDPGERNIRRFGYTDTVSSASTPFRSGDILFSKLRPYLNKVSMVDRGGWCSNEALVYRAITERVSQEYLFNVLRSPEAIAFAAQSSAGTRMPRTSSKKMDSYPVILPPLHEQKRIDDLMNSVDAAISAAQDEVDTAENAYASLLAVWMSKSGRPLEAAISQSTESETVDRDQTYRILGVLRSGEGFIDRGEVSGADTSYSKLFRVRPDQLVYRKLTAWEGPISVSTDREDDGWVSSEFPVFNVDSNVLLPDLLRHMCRWPGLWERIGQRLVGSVLRRKRLNPSDLLQVEVPMPDLDHQHQMVETLDAVRLARITAQTTLDRLRDLRSSMLTALLSGEHEIPGTYDQFLDQSEVVQAG